MPGTRSIRRMRNFYPRPPRGGRLTELLRKTVNTLISIHALREEGDAVRQCSRVSLRIFLSTPSARRATHDLFHSPGFVYEFLSTPSARRATLIGSR